MSKDDLFQNIRKNKHKTKYIIMMYPIIVLMFSNLIYLCGIGSLNGLIHMYNQYYEPINLHFHFSWSLDLIISATVEVIAIIYMTISLIKANDILINRNDAELMTRASSPELFDILDNMTMVAQIPKPYMLVINDPSLNAMTVGKSPKNSAIILTTGLIKSLDDNEMEGVIADEISHIKDHDTEVETVSAVLTNWFGQFGLFIFDITLIVVVFGATFSVPNIRLPRMFTLKKVREADDLEDEASKNADYSDDDIDSGSGGGGVTPIQIITVAIGLGFAFIFLPASIICFLASTLDKAVLSRQRDYLDDQESINLDGNPKELILAFRKIKNRCSMQGVNMSDGANYLVAPKIHQSSLTKWLSIFSTHPSTFSRIIKLKELQQ